MRSRLAAWSGRTGGVLVLFGALVVLGVVLVPSSAANPPSSGVKQASACLTVGSVPGTCDTSALPGGQTVALTFTLTNAKSSNQSLGSANLDSPAGLAIVLANPAPTYVRGTGSFGTNTAGELQLRNLNLAPGSSVSVNFSVVTPCSGAGLKWGPLSDGPQGKQSNNFSGVGNDFTMSSTGFTSSIAVGGGSIDHFGVTLPAGPYTAGTPFTATVTAIDRCGGTATSYNGNATLTSTLDDAPHPLANAQATPLPAGVGAGRAGATISFTNGVSMPSITAVDAETSRTLTATAGAATGTSAQFDVGPGAPAQLAFSAQPPANMLVNSQFGAAVQVWDAFGNLATQASGNVTLSLVQPADPGFGGGSLGGPALSTAASSGVATFSNLTVSSSGSGYALDASYAGAQDGQSNLFNVFDTLSPNCSGGCGAGADGATQIQVQSFSGSVGLGIGPANNTAQCGAGLHPLGSTFTIVPLSGGGGGNITAVLTIPKRGLQGVGVANIVVCKNGGPGTPLVQMSQCAKKNPKAPCILSQTSSNAGDAKITMLITPSDPGGSGFG